MELVEPTMEYDKQIQAYRREFLFPGMSMNGGGSLIRFDNTKDWLHLPKCRKLGIDKILITCVRGNEGSRRTILKNGGIYESTIYEPDRDRYLERYWIDLSDKF